jgi:hypothetical protein
MQPTTSTPNFPTMATGIVPTLGHGQQSQYMQSTTPSVANGKEEIRGWLYKWTNVEREKKKEKKFNNSIICRH